MVAGGLAYLEIAGPVGAAAEAGEEAAHCGAGAGEESQHTARTDRAAAYAEGSGWLARVSGSGRGGAELERLGEGRGGSRRLAEAAGFESTRRGKRESER